MAGYKKSATGAPVPGRVIEPVVVTRGPCKMYGNPGHDMAVANGWHEPGGDRAVHGAVQYECDMT